MLFSQIFLCCEERAKEQEDENYVEPEIEIDETDHFFESGVIFCNVEKIRAQAQKENLQCQR